MSNGQLTFEPDWAAHLHPMAGGRRIWGGFVIRKTSKKELKKHKKKNYKKNECFSSVLPKITNPRSQKNKRVVNGFITTHFR